MFISHSLPSTMASVPCFGGATHADRALLERQASFGAEIREAQRARRASRRRNGRANVGSSPSPTGPAPTITSGHTIVATPALARLAN